MVADAGESTRWSSGPAVTLSEAPALLPPLAPVMVCEPALVAVHALAVHAPFGAIEKVVTAVTSPRELPAASNPCAVNVCEPPAVIVAVEGLIVMWSNAPALTCSDAVPVFPAFVPVTVCAPAAEAVQVAPLQEPFGAIEKLVVDVRSPSELPYWSRPAAVYARDPPEVIEAVDGESTRWSSAAGPMVNAAVAVLPAAVALTVWSPATLAVQMWPVHDPSGATEKDVSAVTSPSELPAPSKASTVYACEAPAAIVASLGLTTM